MMEYLFYAYAVAVIIRFIVKLVCVVGYKAGKIEHVYGEDVLMVFLNSLVFGYRPGQRRKGPPQRDTWLAKLGAKMDKYGSTY